MILDQCIPMLQENIGSLFAPESITRIMYYNNAHSVQIRIGLEHATRRCHLC